MPPAEPEVYVGGTHLALCLPAVSINRVSEPRLLRHVAISSAMRHGLETVKPYFGQPEYCHFL
jgi:hypothetical protein